MPGWCYIARGLHIEPWIEHIKGLREYMTMYTSARLKQFSEEMSCPNCDLICNEEMVILPGSSCLLGSKQDMDDVINAITKVHQNRNEL